MILPLIVGAGIVGVTSLLIWLDEKKRREEWEQLSDEEKEQRLRAAEEERKKQNKFKLLKGKILRRAKHRCENCGSTHRDLWGKLDVYYIDPDGDCTYDNLRALCPNCKYS